MLRSIRLALFMLLLSLGAVFGQPAELTVDRVAALAKDYLRDSAETPLNVNVATVVTDKTGKVKHRAQSNVSLLFHGYNLQTGNFSWNSRSGWFNTGDLRNSMAGDYAAFLAGAFLASAKDSAGQSTLEQPAQPGQPFSVTKRDATCEKFTVQPRYLIPRVACGSFRFRLALNGDKDLEFQHFTYESGGLPVPARFQYLGAATMTGFRLDVDFQKVLLPGDPKPFVWPKETVVTVTTDQGTVAFTNEYARKKP